jgi:hypothetical protein
MSNKIFRGPFGRQAITISDRLVNGALLPGVMVVEDGADFSVAGAGGLGRLLALTSMDFVGQGPDTAYLDNDTGVAYRIEPDQEYSLRAVAATYAIGTPLSTNAAGLLILAGADDRVIAFSQEAKTLGAIARLDVVVANSYIAAS